MHIVEVFSVQQQFLNEQIVTEQCLYPIKPCGKSWKLEGSKSIGRCWRCADMAATVKYVWRELIHVHVHAHVHVHVACACQHSGRLSRSSGATDAGSRNGRSRVVARQERCSVTVARCCRRGSGAGVVPEWWQWQWRRATLDTRRARTT